MGYQYGIPRKLKESLNRLPLGGGVLNHIVGYPRKLGYVLGDGHSGVDIGLENFKHTAALVFYRPYFGYAAVNGGKAGGFDIENYKNPFGKGAVVFGGEVEHRSCGIIHQIALHAVYGLYFRVFFRIQHYLREGLNVSVVGEGDGGHTPAFGGEDYLLGST